MRKSKCGFTLVEIMIVVAIIGMLAAIAMPAFMRSRLRSQASVVLNECRMVDAAIDQWALENAKIQTDATTFDDLTPYLKSGSKLATSGGNDTLGNAFPLATVGDGAKVSQATIDATSDAIADTAEFWGPYAP